MLCVRTHSSKIKYLPYLCHREQHAYSLMQKKERPCTSKHTHPRGRGFRHSMCRRSVFATTRVFAIFARPVFCKCLGAPDMSSRLREVLHPRVFATTCASPDLSSNAHVSSRRHVPSSELSSGVSSRRHVSSPHLYWGNVFARPRVFAPGRVFEGMCLQTPTCLSTMCLLTPRCLRRAFFATPVLDLMCLQKVSSIFRRYVHPPGDCNDLEVNLRYLILYSCSSNQGPSQVLVVIEAPTVTQTLLRMLLDKLATAAAFRLEYSKVSDVICFCAML